MADGQDEARHNSYTLHWRQSKRDLLRVSYVTMGKLRQTIDEYFANKTFGLDILKYLTRSL